MTTGQTQHSRKLRVSALNVSDHFPAGSLPLFPHRVDEPSCLIGSDVTLLSDGLFLHLADDAVYKDVIQELVDHLGGDLLHKHGPNAAQLVWKREFMRLFYTFWLKP